LKGGGKLNAIGMLFSQMQPLNILSDHVKEPDLSEDASPFHGLLISEQTETTKEKNNQEENTDEAVVSIDELLSHMLIGIEKMEENEGETLDKLVDHFIAETDSEKVDPDRAFPVDFQEEFVAVNHQVVQQLLTVIQKAENIISQITNEQDAKQSAPKLIALLEQYTTLEKKYNNEKINPDVHEALKSETPKEHGVWRELLSTFKKRAQFITKQQYNTDAKVTSTDVAKWVQNALTDNDSAEKTIGNPSITSASVPMSRVEQYVVYLNTSQAYSSQNVDQQLIEQFQRVIKESRFSATPNGPSQLSLTLRPDNLGEMMVRLTHVNGEMTVKIIVTSEATKEMLQSNIHQLKNMFSPQQVIIERQELNAQPSQEADGEQQKQPMEDEEQNQQEHSKQNEKSNDDDFETRFHELLMNEKV